MARQDRDTFKAGVDAIITTNSNKEISGADVNTSFDNLADSVPFLGEVTSRKPVRVATTAAGTLATSFENGDTIDGITLATGDRILIKDQATASQNGYYTVNASGAPTRATDMDSSDEVILGQLVYVEEGTSNGGKYFYLSAPTGTITLGTSNLVFTEQSSTFNIGGLSATTSFDPANDYWAIFDNSAGTNRKILLKDVTLRTLAAGSAFSGSADYMILDNNDSGDNVAMTPDSFKEQYGIVSNEGNTGSYTKLNTKVVQIGDWDMDATGSVNVAHGLTLTAIRAVSVIVRNDADTLYRDLVVTGSGDAYFTIDSTNVVLTRNGAGTYDSTDYDSTTYNRGWVTITYEA